MKNIKLITNSIEKFTNSIEKYLISKINLLSIYFNLKKIKKSNKRDKLTVSNFNKYLIFLISLLFLYLFYLSIPSLYDKGRLQKDLTQKLLLEYKLNVSFSSKITYSILPYPNILIENAKLFDDNDNEPNELAQIKKLKIFISQKNLFNQDKLKIKNIVINEANFSVQKNNFTFFNDFIETKFSKKKLNIKKSNIFLKNNNADVISIIFIKNLNLIFDEKKMSNQIDIDAKIFKLPFNASWTKDFKNRNAKFLFKIKKLLFELQNNRSVENEEFVSINKINIRNLKFLSKIKLNKNLISFESQELSSQKNNANYKGVIELDPFDLQFKIDLNKINQDDLVYLGYFFEELLNTGLMFNKNINSKIFINAKNFQRNKLFDSIKLVFNINNGKLNFNDSTLINHKIGFVRLMDSEIKQVEGEVVFTGNFTFSIKNQKEFYKAFQVPKANRKKVDTINFTLQYNMFRDEFNFLSFRLNGIQNVKNLFVESILDNFEKDKENKIDNWIDLKNFINKLIQASI